MRKTKKTFLTADLHFGHENIIKYENRPFRNADHMNESLIKNWNKVVTNQDKVFLLGDVSFLGADATKELINQLNGYIILIAGNHDKRNMRTWYKVGFSEVYKFPIVIEDFIFLSHEPPSYTPPNTPYFYIYGHVHGSEMHKSITKTSACVSVERWDYTPVELEKLKDLRRLV